MQSNASDIWQFLLYCKELVKIGSKNWLFHSFWEVFLFTPCYALWVTPQILHQVKGLMKIYIWGKFRLYSFCGSQVINVQMVSWRSSSHEMAHFERVLGPFSAKYRWILLKFWPEVAHHKKKTVREQSFKMKCLRGNRTYPKATILVHFWDQFTPGKQKIMPKTIIFPETRSLALSNYTSPRFDRNYRILI